MRYIYYPQLDCYLVAVNSDCSRPCELTLRLVRNVAPCTRPTINVIGPLHECKKVCPCTKALPQSGIRAWIKQCQRKRKKEEERQERQRPGGWWKERQPNKTKPTEGTEGTWAQLRLTRQREERLTSRGHRMRPPPPCPCFYTVYYIRYICVIRKLSKVT